MLTCPVFYCLVETDKINIRYGGFRVFLEKG